MKYNLEIFDKIINDILTNSDKHFDEKEVDFYLHLLKKESLKIKLSIKNTVFTLKTNTEIEHYIHKKQLALENLTAIVIKEINAENWEDIYTISENYTQTNTLKIIYRKLWKLQLFIETEYYDFLNMNSTVPYHSIINRKKINGSKIKEIKEELLILQLPNNLLQIVLEPLEQNALENITYGQFKYNDEFINELILILNDKKENFSEQEIIRFLIEFNYNSKIFFDFQINKISTELDTLFTTKAKKEYLFRIMKIYNQTNTICLLTYNPKLIPHKDQMINWLNEEIIYIKMINATDSTSIVSLPNSGRKIKILSGLSVAQLSCFFKLLYDTDILTHKNQSDIFRFVADNIRTSQTDNISAESISTKYYNIETSTMEAVKAKIIELLNKAKN